MRSDEISQKGKSYLICLIIFGLSRKYLQNKMSWRSIAETSDCWFRHRRKEIEKRREENRRENIVSQRWPYKLAESISAQILQIGRVYVYPDGTENIFVTPTSTATQRNDKEWFLCSWKAMGPSLTYLIKFWILLGGMDKFTYLIQ